MNKNSNIGFVGLGNMGKPIFDNLNKEFSNVFGFDKDTSKLKINGFSSSLNEIFEKCKIIIFCIESNEQIIDIIKENAIKKNTIIIDLTSSLPELTKQISSYLKKFESHYIDAGMSGGASGASNGTLTLMLGGSKTICKKIDFILKTFAKNIFYLGKSGNGHLMKLLHNSVCHSTVSYTHLTLPTTD